MAEESAAGSRQTRAIGSGGGLFGSFWVSKRNTCRRYAVKKVAHRKVVSHARSRIKNQSTPFSQATSAGFGWKPT